MPTAPPLAEAFTDELIEASNAGTLTDEKYEELCLKHRDEEGARALNAFLNDVAPETPFFIYEMFTLFVLAEERGEPPTEKVLKSILLDLGIDSDDARFFEALYNFFRAYLNREFARNKTDLGLLPDMDARKYVRAAIFKESARLKRAEDVGKRYFINTSRTNISREVGKAKRDFGPGGRPVRIRDDEHLERLLSGEEVAADDDDDDVDFEERLSLRAEKESDALTFDPEVVRRDLEVRYILRSLTQSLGLAERAMDHLHRLPQSMLKGPKEPTLEEYRAQKQKPRRRGSRKQRRVLRPPQRLPGRGTSEISVLQPSAYAIMRFLFWRGTSTNKKYADLILWHGYYEGELSKEFSSWETQNFKRKIEPWKDPSRDPSRDPSLMDLPALKGLRRARRLRRLRKTGAVRYVTGT